MDNNYNKMQLSDNSNDPSNKKKGFFAKIKENKEKKLRQKELAKLEQMPAPSFNHKSRSENIMGPGIKSRVVTQEEALEKKWKRKRIIRNILTIPEIILVVFLAMRLKEKYIDYSNNVNQVINYSTGKYIYEIHRNDYSIKVSKLLNEACDTSECERNLGNYDITFEENQLLKVRTLFDFYFSFKNGSKSMTIDDLKTKFAKKCFYSLINNDESLLGGKKFKKYKEIDFNQMSSYTRKGYQLLEQNNQLNLYIAIGEKPSSGYTLSIYGAYKNDNDDLVIYVSEKSPDANEELVTMIAHPVLRIVLEEAPKSISIYDIETGEAYNNYDSVQQSRFVQNRSGYIKN